MTQTVPEGGDDTDKDDTEGAGDAEGGNDTGTDDTEGGDDAEGGI